MPFREFVPLIRVGSADTSEHLDFVAEKPRAEAEKEPTEDAMGSALYNPIRLTFLALAASGLAALQANAQQADAALIAAAQAEGQVVFYNGANITVPRPLAEKFEKKFGVKVVTFEGRASGVQERLRSELGTGRKISDVLGGGSGSMVDAMKAGLLQPHGALTSLARLREQFRGNDVIVPYMFAKYGLLVNTTLVSEAEQPRSWFDLLEPKWKGKILADDPRAAGSGNSAFRVLYEVFGREFHERLAAQELVLSRDVLITGQRIARGEYPIYIPYSMQGILTLPGLPVRASIPNEGAPITSISLAMVKDAPHPNAARLFMDFYLTEEAQEVVVDKGYDSVTNDRSDKIQPAMKPFANAKLMPEADPERLNEMFDIFKQLYK